MQVPRLLSWLAAAPLLLLLCTDALSQAIVVSEYLNNPGPSATKEWTELLVVKDNLNIVGWTVHDHSDFDPRTGPVFNDHPLFRNLRAGTIIVIDHRLDSPPQKLDTVADDGFLLLYQLDARFFTTGGNGLDISQPGELIIIKDDQGKAVHALGHFNSAAIQPQVYTDLTCPKVAYDAPSQLSNNHSNRVTGRSIDAYGAGLGTDSTSYGPQVITAPPEDPGTGPSKGLPNLIDNAKRLAKRLNTNQLFWRETRQPTWSSTPTVTVDASDQTKNVLTWTALIDPHTEDKTTGYLVLRDTNGFSPATFPGIRDGAIYSVGTNIGTARVVAVQTTASGTTYTDTDAPCGSTFVYRVYGFRYGADNMMPLNQTADTTARGRQYTESVYAQSATITKPKPPKPTIFVTRTVICPGDTTTLWTNATTGIETYTWMRNGVPLAIGFTTSGVVRQPGTYRLKVTAAGGCTEMSNEVEVLPMPAPKVTVDLGGIQSLCVGDTLILNVQTKAQGYELIRNGNVISTQPSSRFIITTSGVYSVRVKTGTQCDGVSEEVTVTTPDIRYRFSPDSLDFGTLGQCQASTTRDVQLVNEGTDALTVASVTMPPGFALASPAPGFVLPAGKQQTVTIVFSPANTGITAGTGKALATPCDIVRSLNLRGVRTQATASLNKVDVDFGTYTTCPRSSVNDSIRFELTNSGSADITVTPPAVSPPFYTAFSKVILKPGQTAPITVRYIPFGADLNRATTQTIFFPYTDALCSDTLKATATLRAASFQPSVELVTDSVSVGVSNSCNDTLIGTVTLRNTGTIATVVSAASTTNVTYSGLPMDIPAGQTRSVSFLYHMSGGNGTYTETDTLIVSPCGLHLPVTISGTIQSPTYLIADSLNLGRSIFCQQDPTLSGTLMVVPSLAQPNASIRSVTVTAPFNTTLTPGTTIGDSLAVPIHYSPTVPGTYQGTITIVIEPCGDTITTTLLATTDSFLRSTIIDNPDFGILTPSSSAQRLLVIENTGTSAVTVNKLSNIALPWTVFSETPPLPVTLASGDSVVIMLEYSYTGPSRRDTLQILSKSVAGPCADSIPLVLTGATEAEPDTLERIKGVTLVLPSDITVPVGSLAQIPVALVSNTSLTGKGLKDIQATILYNPTVVRMVTSAATSASVLSTTITELVPGRATLLITASTELTESDPLVRISASTYLGDAVSSVLDIDTVVSSQAEIDARDGTITVVGNCSITTQTIALGTPPSIAVRTSSQMDEVYITLTTLTNDPVQLTVCDGSGQVVEDVMLSLQPGKHELQLAMGQWPPGLYGVTMQHGLYVGTAVFVRSH